MPLEMELPLRRLLNILEPRQDPPKGAFTFVDLFAGIGGIRLGFESQGGTCIFTCEWDKYACQTYKANFSDDTHDIVGDITQVNAADIPDHDILLAGFPCQPFSIAGVSKKKSLGRDHGFKDLTQGTLFYDVARIIDAKRPRSFLLENVKNLRSHDGGLTYKVIKEILERKLGYKIYERVIDARSFVPQHRERILIVGFKDHSIPFSWDDFRLPSTNPTMASVLHPEDGTEEPEEPYTIGEQAKVNSKYVLSNKLWSYLKNYAQKHRAAGNGFGFGIVGPNDTARTLSARYYKDGSEILVDRGGRRNPRRLTPRECARLMGFDPGRNRFKIPVSDTQAYKQFGNSVVVPVIEEAARIIVPHIVREIREEEKEIKQVQMNFS
jgi:DNA (cytosine-5)-methyltransferase 1